MQDYEVLEVFYKPLDDDDFKALWEAIGWPLNITKQVTVTAKIAVQTYTKIDKKYMGIFVRSGNWICGSIDNSIF